MQITEELIEGIRACRDTLAIPADYLVLHEPQDPVLGYSAACVKARSRYTEQGNRRLRG
jgi:hypothetical protein